MNVQHVITQNLNSCRNLCCNAAVQDVAKKKTPKVLEKFYNSKGLEKFLKSDGVGKLLDISAKNPGVITSLYSLFLCVLLRPATIMALPGKNIEDKKYASAHSIASGIIGFLTTVAIISPIAGMVGLAFKHPAKYLKLDTLKKLHPNISTVMCKNPKTGQVVEKVKITKGGELIQSEKYAKMREREIAHLKETGVWNELTDQQRKNLNDPTVCMSNQPIIHNGQPLRSPYLKREKGKACSLLPNGTPETEELKLYGNKNTNVGKLFNMLPDLLIAFPRASITVATIPPILAGVFGLKKSSSKAKPAEVKEVSFNSNQAELKSFDYAAIFPGLKKEVQ